LASLYRNLSSPVGPSEVVDKRVMLSSAIYDVGAAAPLSTSGSTGSVFFRNNRAQGSSGSGVYVKNSTGSWLELAQNNGPQVPVGSIVAWGGTGSLPTGWLECNGATLNRTTYADLFSAIGTQFGAPSSTEFSLPNLNNKFLRGTTTANAVGTTGGSDNTEVPVPYHRHSHDHKHGMIHYHDVDHSHDADADNNSTDHTHGYNHKHNGNAADGGNEHSHGMGHTTLPTSTARVRTPTVRGSMKLEAPPIATLITGTLLAQRTTYKQLATGSTKAPKTTPKG